MQCNICANRETTANSRFTIFHSCQLLKNIAAQRPVLPFWAAPGVGRVA
jgi:hypothetical protein